MASPAPPATDPVLRRLTNIKHIVLVLSGKGGVGKSSVAVQLALCLVHQNRDDASSSQARGSGGSRVGLLDVDLTGPSVPRMVGAVSGEVIQSRDGWVPVYLDLDEGDGKGKGRAGEEAGMEGAAGSARRGETEEDIIEKEGKRGVLKCMSIGFLLKNPNDAVVWRGPKKNAMIRQFLVDVRWGELDWLIIDTPPGTSDEHISLLEHLAPLFTTPSSPTLPLPSLTSILVTTPQAVSLSDVSKELSFARRTRLPVLGLVENMSGYVCPHCGEVQNVFGVGGGEEFCRKDRERAGRERGGEDEEGLRFLGRVPIDAMFTRLMDHAATSTGTSLPTPVMVVNGRPTSTPAFAEHGSHSPQPNGHASPSHSHLPQPQTNGASATSPSTAPRNLLERYRMTPTFPIFQGICRTIVELVEEREEAARRLAAGEDVARGQVREVDEVVAHA